jgi:erythronate-4-phosphate dehydrogenase
LKIVADENIPQVAEAFSDLGEVELLPGRKIERRHLLECQCLLVRTVTQIDAGLLHGTAVEFVGTATIGTDHVDQNYLQNNHIAFSNAAGCNAEAASEYVISGLFALSERKGFDPFQLKAGIIGCGNVGSRVLQKLQTLGIETLINDPPLEASKVSDSIYQSSLTPFMQFVDLDTILSECNFITLHVPLTKDGGHPTWHLFDKTRLRQLTNECILVNAARGPVIDNSALLELLDQRTDLTIFLDTWENEPDISRKLLQKVDLATPHIAGYSVEGRLRGTQMILDAACRHFSASSNWLMSNELPEIIPLPIEPQPVRLKFWQQLFVQHHDIWQDHLALTHSTIMTDVEFARHFDSLRKVYPNRFEYERYRLPIKTNKKAAAIARELLFKLS